MRTASKCRYGNDLGTKIRDKEGASPVTKIESFLNRNTRVQMQAIKEAVEAWTAKEPAIAAV